MFRIRRVYDDLVPTDRAVIATVHQILAGQFPTVPPDELAHLARNLRAPSTPGFRPWLFVAERPAGRVRAFALAQYDPDLGFCMMEWLAAAPGETGGGLGGALYERVREEAQAHGVRFILIECLPDDPALSPDKETRRQNAARLRFYAQYGAGVVAGTKYETPIPPDTDDPPYLVLDPLGAPLPASSRELRPMVRAILERKYADLCPPDYVAMVVESFDGPLVLQARDSHPRRAKAAQPMATRMADDRRIAVVVHRGHEIHHVRDRGYVEAPARIPAIEQALRDAPWYLEAPARNWGMRHIEAVHDHGFLNYFKRVCERLPENATVYPYVFPIRNVARPPVDLEMRAGYYCIDTFTPLNRQAFAAARGAVDCTLTAADSVLKGRRVAYALVRPPGHHAEHRVFGGFCYFCNGAVAANYLSAHGKVAMLDIDYHHGNGQQDIFLRRSDVFTVSIHGHPRFSYPYFSGFVEETGEGEGRGFNLNMPLPEQVDGPAYLEALDKALRRITAFAPSFLIVSLGFDIGKGDPTGTWSLRPHDFEAVGRGIGALGLPTLVVQEGGYRIRTLAHNARGFFDGLWQGAFSGPKRTGQ